MEEMKEIEKRRNLNNNEDSNMIMNYHYMINSILRGLEKNKNVFFQLENALKNEFLFSKTIITNLQELAPFTVFIYFNGFQKEKGKENKWEFKYLMYSKGDGFSSLPLGEIYKDFDKILYEKIIEISDVEYVYLKMNKS